MTHQPAISFSIFLQFFQSGRWAHIKRWTNLLNRMQTSIFCKLLAHLSLIVMLSASAACAPDTESSPFPIVSNNEKDLAGDFLKRYGHSDGERFEINGVFVRCFFPNVRGGGRGIRDIVVYSGNDKYGWNLVFWCRTMDSKVVMKVAGAEMQFSGEDDKLLFSIPVAFLRGDRGFGGGPMK